MGLLWLQLASSLVGHILIRRFLLVRILLMLYKTCRRILNCQYCLQIYVAFIDWLNYYIIEKHNGMAPIKVMLVFLVLFLININWVIS
jgi:hypothetical protein